MNPANLSMRPKTFFQCLCLFFWLFMVSRSTFLANLGSILVNFVSILVLGQFWVIFGSILGEF